MTTKCYFFVFLLLSTVLLYCTARLHPSHEKLDAKDESYRDSWSQSFEELRSVESNESDQMESSECSQLCPCSYNRTNKVLDCRNISVLLSQDLPTTTGVDPGGVYPSTKGSENLVKDTSRHLSWPISILLLLLTVVSFGFIIVSYSLYQVHVREISKTTYAGSDGANVIDSNITPSGPVMSSTSRENSDLSLSHEYQVPTNYETVSGDVDFSYEYGSYQRESVEGRKKGIQKNKDGNVSNTETVRQQIPGLNSSHFSVQGSTDLNGAARSGSLDDEDYEITNNEEYTSLNIVHVYESQVTYQTLTLPLRESVCFTSEQP